MSVYSQRTLSHVGNPHRVGVLPDATVVGMGGLPGKGPYIVLHLKITEGQITAASFQTYGCPGAIASGSALTKLVEGRMVSEVRDLREDDIDTELGGLPRNKRHCLTLAISALKNALEQGR